MNLIKELSMANLRKTINYNQHSSGKTRQKKTFRLISAAQRNKFDEKNQKKNENSILNDHQKTEIFYGPPTDCSDLFRLGYNLNGYYLVKRVIDFSNNQVSLNLETVYCAFKQPKGSVNLSIEETRIGLLKFLDDKNKSESSSEGNLNSKGKCAVMPEEDIYQSGKNINQWDCNQHKRGQLKRNVTSLSSGDRHLCNGHGKCAASPMNSSDSNVDLIQWKYFEEEGHRYYFVDSSSRAGFYLIRNDHGKCLSVPENKKDNGILIYINDCNSSEEGQNWKWNI